MEAAGAVVDLRGRGNAETAITNVLEDPSGRRARRVRLAGGLVAACLLVWVGLLVLGGLGLIPVAGVPLGDALRKAPRVDAKATPRVDAPRTSTSARPLSAPAAARPVTGAGGRRRSGDRVGDATRRSSSVPPPALSRRPGGPAPASTAPAAPAPAATEPALAAPDTPAAPAAPTAPSTPPSAAEPPPTTPPAPGTTTGTTRPTGASGTAPGSGQPTGAAKDNGGGQATAPGQVAKSPA